MILRARRPIRTTVARSATTPSMFSWLSLPMGK
jgi:hypothetical protein